MARREQAGGGSARRGRSSGGRSGGRGGRTRWSNRGRRTTRHTAQAHGQRPNQRGGHAAVGEHPTAGSVWLASAAPVGGAEPLLTLAAGQARGQTSLALAGAEQTALGDALQAWGAARDLAANRAWRRPGGLVRMAGL